MGSCHSCTCTTTWPFSCSTGSTATLATTETCKSYTNTHAHARTRARAHTHTRHKTHTHKTQNTKTQHAHTRTHTTHTHTHNSYVTILLNGFIHSVMYTYYFVSMHTSNIWSISLSLCLGPLSPLILRYQRPNKVRLNHYTSLNPLSPLILRYQRPSPTYTRTPTYTRRAIHSEYMMLCTRWYASIVRLRFALSWVDMIWIYILCCVLGGMYVLCVVCLPFFWINMSVFE